MKAITKTKFIFCGFLILMLISSIPYDGVRPLEKETNNAENGIKSAAGFQLIEEFESSTYYLSPESSPGENDYAFFSFQANKNGNYSIEITNYPSILTQSSPYELDTSFDNPNGTDNWIMSYRDFTMDNPVDQNLKVLISTDKGKSWREKTISSFEATGDNLFDYYYFLMKTAIASVPDLSMMGAATLANYSEIVFFKSEDMGETWSDSYKIADISEIGYFIGEERDDVSISYDIAILENGSMYLVMQTNQTSHTSLVFYQSNDDGETWNGPYDIGCLGTYNCTNPMLEVDYASGNYWLMAESEEFGDKYLRWANYTSSQSLSNTVSFDYYNDKISGNYDFFLGEGPYNFNVIQNRKITDDLTELHHLYKSTMGSIATNKSLGETELLTGPIDYNLGFNAANDGADINILFPTDYSGNYELYKYINYKNNTFWKTKGPFHQFQVIQTIWDGRTGYDAPINTTMVKVDFAAQNASNIISDSLFITLDNMAPSFEEYTQQRQYFNPKSSNITLTEVPWEILPSERATSILEVYNKEKSLTGWSQATANNWEDSDPYIFTSDNGIIYILYVTIESGRKVLNLIRSEDKGISWSTPTSIYETSGNLNYYTGAAWGDFVCVYEKDESNSGDFLFRSFDRGENFYAPINFSTSLWVAPHLYQKISKFVITQDGVIYLTYVDKGSTPHYWLYSSPDLGLSWFIHHDYHFGYETSVLHPDIVYDVTRNKLHWLIPTYNDTLNQMEFIFRTYEHRGLKFPIYPDRHIGPFFVDLKPNFEEFNQPHLMITMDREQINTTVIAIFVQDFDSGFDPVYSQIISDNHGFSWSTPQPYKKLNFSSFTSHMEDVYLSRDMSDGDDYEIFFSRNTTLVRLQEEELTSSRNSTVNFDGLNDFGEYLDAGNYSFMLSLKDDAGNKVNETGWFYVDYEAPQITDITVEQSVPVPSINVNISATITDDIGYNTKLYYSRDGQAWQSITMNTMGGNIYWAIIPGVANVKEVKYYIESEDLAGNINDTQDNEDSYGDADAPSIRDMETNMTRTPTPMDYVKISANISDNTAFEATLYYSKDSQNWITVAMSSSGDIYSASIPRSYGTQEIRYYINATDYAGNTVKYDNDGLYYSYEMPDIQIETLDIFDKEEEYVSGKDYEISIRITQDLDFVDKVIFRYSFDNGETWEDLQLEQNSPEFKGTLTDIPEDLKTLEYEVVIVDIFGNETLFINTQQIGFYPEIPSISLEPTIIYIYMIASAAVGFFIAFSYIKLKKSSHDKLSKMIAYKQLEKKMKGTTEEHQSSSISDAIKEKKEMAKVLERGADEMKSSKPFLMAYITILGINIAIFFAAVLFSFLVTEMGVLLMGGSLLISVLGYMFLMSKDITNIVYSEKITFKNIILETLQIIFMLLNLLVIFIIGFQIGWFRYYLIESTFDFGDVSIPRLYISMIGVFFTSLVLVAITTLMKLNKTVKSLRTQREKGASDNLLLYVKNQESSKLITRLGYKTIAFLATVLISVITTTELLTVDSGIALGLIILPFIGSSFLALLINRKLESRSIDRKTVAIDMPFIDSVKKCSNCGEEAFLSDKFCPNCGDQLVFHEMIGTYINRCAECNAMVHDKALFCPECGKSLKKE